MASFRTITAESYEDALKRLRPGEKLVTTDHPENPLGQGRRPVTSEASFRSARRAHWTFLAES
jgi:hypothetical protein